VRHLAEGLAERNYDLVYNLNFSRVSLLFAYLAGRKVRGYRPVKGGREFLREPWLALVYALVHTRQVNRMHLSDVFRHLAPVAEPEPWPAAPDTKEGEPIIALQVATRHPKRTWPLAAFTRLAALPVNRLGARVWLVEGGWPEAAQRLEAWLRESFPRPPDLTINLTPSRMGSVLAYATGAQDIRGMAANRTWELRTRPDWASYALIVSKARQANPFNLVDLFLREGGLAPDGQGLEVAVPREAYQEAEAFFEGLRLPANTALVGLFPGASHPARCWPPQQLARTALTLLENRSCHFFIFGSTGEAPLGEAISQLMPASATTSLLGRTTPAVLAAYLERLDLLITNDTGPMHLAAAVGTPAVALFLASARVQDTGPVGKGHVILEPQLDCHPCLAPCPQPRCHQAITPEAVSFWADKLLNKEPLFPLDDAPVLAPIRAYLSTTDPQGYHAYLPLVRRPLGPRDFWLWVHRAAWGQVLDGSTFSYAPLKEWLERMLLRHYLPPREDPGFMNGEHSLGDLCQTASRGEKLASEIGLLANSGQRSPVRVLQKVEALGVVDLTLRRIGVAFPELAAFVEFFFQEQRDKDGTEIPPLARELEQSYGQLRRLGELALERLAEMRMILGPFAGGENPSEMAQTVQDILTNREALPPESEGIPCR
jgi:ADP-heptose:LPS heptosyltransferase